MEFWAVGPPIWPPCITPLCDHLVLKKHQKGLNPKFNVQDVLRQKKYEIENLDHPKVVLSGSDQI